MVSLHSLPNQGARPKFPKSMKLSVNLRIAREYSRAQLVKTEVGFKTACGYDCRGHVLCIYIYI